MSVQHILDKVTKELKDIPGIVGIVLGGSRARGTHQPNSDIDIGIYYDNSLGFDVINVNEAAKKLDDQQRENLITPLGAWGTWINGGGWLTIEGYHVDIIFRDINRVEKVIDECLKGNITSHYHTGHPHAFLNVIYMGEISICNILEDKTGKIAELKAKTVPYPEPVKFKIIEHFMFEASFSLMFAKDNLEKDDLSYVTGHCYRSIASLNQVLFAINEEYCINEKKAVRMIETFKKKPFEYKNNIDQMITLLSPDIDRMKQAVEMLEKLINETSELLNN